MNNQEKGNNIRNIFSKISSNFLQMFAISTWNYLWSVKWPSGIELVKSQLLMCNDKNYGNIFFAGERNLLIRKCCDIFTLDNIFSVILAASLVSKTFVLRVTLRR